MDSALLQERAAFKRKAMAIPTVENKKVKSSEDKKSDNNKKNKSEQMSQSAKAKLDLAQMKSLASGSSAFRFGVLTKIVRFMKVRV